MRALVGCSDCAWAYTYPIDVPRSELACPNPECGMPPKAKAVMAVLQDDDEAVEQGLKALFVSGGMPA